MLVLANICLCQCYFIKLSDKEFAECRILPGIREKLTVFTELYRNFTPEEGDAYGRIPVYANSRLCACIFHGRVQPRQKEITAQLQLKRL